MAASKPVMLPGADINKEIECRVCMEQKTLRILTCGHKCCQECIGKCVRSVTSYLSSKNGSGAWYHVSNPRLFTGMIAL